MIFGSLSSVHDFWLVKLKELNEPSSLLIHPYTGGTLMQPLQARVAPPPAPPDRANSDPHHPASPTATPSRRTLPLPLVVALSCVATTMSPCRSPSSRDNGDVQRRPWH